MSECKHGMALYEHCLECAKDITAKEAAAQQGDVKNGVLVAQVSDVFDIGRGPEYVLEFIGPKTLKAGDKIYAITPTPSHTEKAFSADHENGSGYHTRPQQWEIDAALHSLQADGGLDRGAIANLIGRFSATAAVGAGELADELRSHLEMLRLDGKQYDKYTVPTKLLNSIYLALRSEAALLEGLSRQPASGAGAEWVSVTERLPEVWQEVLLYSPNRGIQVGHVVDHKHAPLGDVWNFGGKTAHKTIFDFNVTFWQPIKAPHDALRTRTAQEGNA